MKILISGSHGLVGSALAKALQQSGYQVLVLVRGKATSANEIEWDPKRGLLSLHSVEGLDAVVHLAGEAIAEGRWSDEKKQRIRESRVQGTRLLAEKLAETASPPGVFVGASAIGFYGDRGDELLTEQSAAGTGFLADVCVEWERATEAAQTRGIRTVLARFGVILSTDGGALAKMLPPFRMGVGGRVGDGKQWMSWIALTDVVAGLLHLIKNASIAGPVNFVAPNPVTNAEFTKKLGTALSRPTIFPIPAFGVRLAFGEMADALLLSSQRVVPAVLKASGFEFQYSELSNALQAIL
jgi:uncharacterized protein